MIKVPYLVRSAPRMRMMARVRSRGICCRSVMLRITFKMSNQQTSAAKRVRFSTDNQSVSKPQDLQPIEAAKHLNRAISNRFKELKQSENLKTSPTYLKASDWRPNWASPLKVRRIQKLLPNNTPWGKQLINSKSAPKTISLQQQNWKPRLQKIKLLFGSLISSYTSPLQHWLLRRELYTTINDSNLFSCDYWNLKNPTNTVGIR